MWRIDTAIRRDACDYVEQVAWGRDTIGFYGYRDTDRIGSTVVTVAIFGIYTKEEGNRRREARARGEEVQGKIKLNNL